MVKGKKLFLTAVIALAALAGTETMAQSFGDDLCPKPNLASKQTPDDLASVQADIERFALCLERAELLESLNQVSLKNTDSLAQMSAGPGFLNSMQGANTGNLPPLAPVSIDLEDALGVNDRGLGGVETGRMTEQDEIDEDESMTPWVINDIYGITPDLRARITSKDGEVANVRKGDLLSDGMRVTSITQSGIKLRGDEEISLMWAK